MLHLHAGKSHNYGNAFSAGVSRAVQPTRSDWRCRIFLHFPSGDGDGGAGPLPTRGPEQEECHVWRTDGLWSSEQCAV